MKRIITTAILVTSILSVQAQTYRTGWDNAIEQAGWVEYELGVSSTLNDWDYEANSTVSVPNQLVHYYPVGGSSITDDWFVSPVFNFSAGGSIDSLMYKFLGFGTPMTGDTIAIYLLNGSADPAQATSRQLLKIYQGADYQNDNTWRLESNITIPPTVGNSYIAFRYKTIVNWLDTKFDNLKISYNFPSSVMNRSKEANTLIVYPNPTKGEVAVKLKDASKIKNIMLYDVYGKLISIDFDHSTLNTNGLSKGLYFIKVVTDDRTLSQQLFVE